MISKETGQLPCCQGRRHETGTIPGLGRSPGGGQGNPLQYSCLGNPVERGGWWATVPGVAKSQDTTEVTWHTCTQTRPFQTVISAVSKVKLEAVIE